VGRNGRVGGTGTTNKDSVRRLRGTQMKIGPVRSMTNSELESEETKKKRPCEERKKKRGGNCGTERGVLKSTVKGETTV